MTKRSMTLCALAALFLANSPYRDSSITSQKTDGVWRMLSLEYLGDKWENTGREFPRWIIQGDRITMDNGPGLQQTVTVRWDTSRKPAALDVMDLGKITLRGVYRVTGDRLVICAGSDSRPGELAPRPGKDEWRIVLERQ